MRKLGIREGLAKIFAPCRRLASGRRSAVQMRTSSLAVQATVADAKHSPTKQTTESQGLGFCLVGEAGFGPAKSVTTDLQSAPFGRSGIPPYLILELVNGVEPSTC